MTRTIITAAAIAFASGPALSQTADQSDMLRISLTQSLAGIGVAGDRVAALSPSELSVLRHIVEGGGDSESQKAFRARTLLDRTAK